MQPCIRDCFCFCMPLYLALQSILHCFCMDSQQAAAKTITALWFPDNVAFQVVGPEPSVVGLEIYCMDLICACSGRVFVPQQLCCEDMLTLLSTSSTGCILTSPSLTNLSSPATLTNVPLPAKPNMVHHKNAFAEGVCHLQGRQVQSCVMIHNSIVKANIFGTLVWR